MNLKQISIEFDEHNLIAFLSEQDDKHMVAIKPICDALGIEYQRQYKKVKADPKFNCSTYVPPFGSADGKSREMTCIPVDEVAGFLYGINSRKVSAEVAPRLLRFQKKLQVVMHEAVTGRVTKQVIDALKQALRAVQYQLAEQQQIINTLIHNQTTQKALSDYALDKDASLAGSRLASQKVVNKITGQFH